VFEGEAVVVEAVDQAVAAKIIDGKRSCKRVSVGDGAGNESIVNHLSGAAAAASVTSLGGRLAESHDYTIPFCISFRNAAIIYFG